MNNFFIANVSNRKKTRLKIAEIPYLEMEVDDVSGLVFEQVHIIDGLRVLKFDVTEQSNTSIPGIVRLAIATSNIVTFNPEALAEPEVLGVVISAPHGHKNEHWAWLFKHLELWAKAHLGAIKKMVIYESDRLLPKITALEGELHIVLGQYLDMANAKVSPDSVEYYPAGRIICLRNISDYPDRAILDNVISKIERYLPAVLASTIEEAETLIPQYISFTNWEGCFKRVEFEKIIRQTLPKTVCNGVIVSVPHGKNANPVTTDEFMHIFIWSAPYGRRVSRPPSQMWGHLVGCRDDSFLPTETGLVIYETNGHPVAEVIGNNLYIFHDAIEEDMTGDYEILRKILEETAKIIKLTPEERLAIINAPKVIISNRVGTLLDADKFKAETEAVLLPVLNRKIFIHNVNGQCPLPAIDGHFHIWLYSSTTGVASRPSKMPDVLFGFETNNKGFNWSYFQPSEMGVEIIDNESLFSPAELLDDNLYIHIPLTAREMSGRLGIYRRILELVAVELNRTPEEIAERDKAIKEIRRQRTIKSFVAICQKRQEVDIARAKAELGVVTSNIAVAQKNLIAQIRQEGDLRRNLKSWQDHLTGSGTEFEAEYDRLFKIEGVESVIVQENRLIINTYPIYITTNDSNKDNKEVTFDIGKFHIEIYFNGENGGLLFFNTTRQGKGGYNGYNIHHPHVNIHGQPCLGNITEMIAQLIAEYQFAALASLAIQFLETVNLDDGAGREIFKCWPEVEKPKGDK